MAKVSQNISTLTMTALFSTMVSIPQNAMAQGFDPDLYSGGKARVYLSSNLRALSESVTEASCRIHADIEADAARADLETYWSTFNTILNGLKDGNPALGIPTAETSARNLSVLEQVANAWDPMQWSADNLLKGTVTDNEILAMRYAYRELFDLTVVLAADISGTYSDPQELLQSDATVLNFASRQATFASRMSRIVCGLAGEQEGLGTIDELQETVDLFELSLVALRDGFPDAGINPPPNDAVKGSLEQAYAIWEQGRSVFDDVISGEEASPERVIEASALGEELAVAMRNTITLYLIAVPGQEGVYRLPLTAYAETELSEWLTNPDLIAAINAQNALHADLTEDQIIELDNEWRAEASAGGGALISDLLGRPVSAWLNEQQLGTAGLVTEVFVMDNKGLNVAQSVETSDYWQGDEAKWQETYGKEDGGLHISEVEFDDSTGYYQTQASLPIVDPATNEPIGAVTFGINIQGLM